MNPKTEPQKRLYIEGRLALSSTRYSVNYNHAVFTRADFAPAYIMRVESRVNNYEALKKHDQMLHGLEYESENGTSCKLKRPKNSRQR